MIDYDYYDEEREAARAEARRDAYIEQHCVRCLECGAIFDPGFHPATRWEPAYEDHPECPECDSIYRTGDIADAA